MHFSKTLILKSRGGIPSGAWYAAAAISARIEHSLRWMADACAVVAASRHRARAVVIAVFMLSSNENRPVGRCGVGLFWSAGKAAFPVNIWL